MFVLRAILVGCILIQLIQIAIMLELLVQAHAILKMNKHRALRGRHHSISGGVK